MEAAGERYQWKLPMEAEGVFLTIAEIAVGFVGFGALIVAFFGGRRAWQPIEVVRFRSLVVVGLFVTFAALLPFPLHYAGFEGNDLWRLTSAITAVGILAAVAVIAPWGMAAAVQARSFFWSIHAAMVALAAFAVCGMNAMGIGFAGTVAGHLTGVVLLLYLGAAYFLRLLITSGPRADTGDTKQNP